MKAARSGHHVLTKEGTIREKSLTIEDLNDMAGDLDVDPLIWMEKNNIPIETLHTISLMLIGIYIKHVNQNLDAHNAFNNVISTAFRLGWDAALKFGEVEP